MKARWRRPVFAALGIVMALSLSTFALAAYESPMSDQENLELKEAMDLENKVQGESYDDAGLLTYRSENGEVTIMSCSEAAMGDIYIPAAINGEPVTAVNDYAFLFCTAVTSVTLPETVNRVGEYAFFCCTKLACVTFEGALEELGEKAFYRCYDLTEVHVKGTVGKVGAYAFSNCTALATVDFQSVEDIGDYAFSGCISLASVDFQGVSDIGDYAFSGCTSLTGLPIRADGGSLTVGSYAFSGSGLTEVALPAEVISLGEGVFSGCVNLKTVTMDDGMAVQQMGKRLFYNCTALTTVHLPSSWTVIPDEAFYLCSKLELTLPDQLTGIGAYAFYFCRSLPHDLVIPAGVTEIGEGAFQYCALTSVTLPEGLTEVKAYTFDHSPELTRISLPEGLVSIEKYAFYGSSPQGLKLPSTLETLGDSAFGTVDGGVYTSHAAVSEIELPEALKYIGSDALGCVTWMEMDELVLPEGLLHIEYLFDGVKKLVLPASLEEIGYGVFSNHEALEEVVILCPSSAFGYWDDEKMRGQVKTGFFDGCTNLTRATIPEDWTEIPTDLFRSTGLTGITIPEGVTTIGVRAFYQCYNLESVQLPGTVTAIHSEAFRATALTGITLPDGLTTIGGNAFFGTKLTSLTLPQSLETVGEGAFGGCTSLKKLTANCVLSASMFQNCKSLTTVTLGAGVTEIPDNCFSGCASLETVRLSNKVKTIGVGAFSNCASLSSINFPEGLEEIYRSAFANTALTTVSLPSTLIRLEPRAFAGISTLTTVTLADGMANDAFRVMKTTSSFNPVDQGGMEGYWDYGYLVAYEESAFYNCPALCSIKFPSNWTYIPAKFLNGCHSPLGTITIGGNITAIGSYAFADAIGITEIILPEGLQSLGAYALYGCTGLTSLKLPEGLPEDGLGEYAIANCTNLKEISLPSSWSFIPDGLFQNNQSIESYVVPEGIVRIGVCAFADSALKELTLPDTVTEIGTNAFQNCTDLTKITLSDALTAIGAKAFQNCTSLTEITLPEGLETLGEYAFSGTGLTHITIPGSVNTIGHMAFYDCDGLTSVEIQPGVTAIDALAFAYCDRLETISIPDSVVNLTRTILYGSNPGKVTVQCSAGSMAEDLVESLLYLASNNSPRLEGAVFHFYSGEHLFQYEDGSAIEDAEHYYFVDYQGMSFQISGGAGSFPSYQEYMQRNNISRYSASLLGWDPSWTSLTVPADVGGIPIVSFGNTAAYAYDTGKLYSQGLAAYTMSVYVEDERGNTVAQSRVGQLKSLTIGENMTTVSGNLSYCTGLETIIFPEGVTAIKSYPEGGSVEKFGIFQGLTQITSVELPSTLVSIGESTFKDCTNLSNVTFREGLTTIDEGAFAGTALTDVYLPSTLTNLHAAAFDPNVVFHFTGNIGSSMYTYVDSAGNTHTVYTLPDLLESLGMRIEQFTGNGLDGQDTYFISTASAGLAGPVNSEAVGDVDTLAETAPVLENLDVPNEIVYEEAETEEIPENTEELTEEPPEEEPPEEEIEEPMVYEIVLNVMDVVRNNPLATALIVCLTLAAIIFGAASRWITAKREDQTEN